MEDRTFIIGREGHIYLGDPSVSRKHAEIRFCDGKIFLRDLDSTNGIYLVINGKMQRIRQECVLPKQPIVIGNFHCTVQGLMQGMGAAGIFERM